MSEATPEKKKVGGRKPGATSLTVSQKAEAAALWRAGSVTLEDLSKKYKKRPETFSRLFKKMGVTKGSVLAETTKEMDKVVAAASVDHVAQTLKEIAALKADHIRYTTGIAKLTWAEIVRAKQAGLKIENLKELLLTLKIAGEIFAMTRKEGYAVLGVEKMEQAEEFEELPELTVRELTPTEVGQLRDQAEQDELGIEMDPGAEMLPVDDDEDV